MNSRKNTLNGRLAKMTLGVLAVVLLGLASPEQSQAQLLDTTTNFTFNDVPIAKAVPNPCTDGVVLVTGEMDIAIKTTAGSAGYSIDTTFNSTGKGEDALADGTLILDGTQK